MRLWQRIFPKKRKSLSPKKRRKKRARITWSEWALLGVVVAAALGLAIWMGSMRGSLDGKKDQKQQKPAQSAVDEETGERTPSE